MNSLNQQLIITSSPHLHSQYSIDFAMRDVIVSLSPAIIAAVYFFGMPAAYVMLVCTVAAIVTEYICQKIMGRAITITDGSAALTGLLLAMCLPPSLPLWMSALGSVFAIVIGKQVFGGLGCNVFNPAHIGRAMLLTSMPAHMTTWTEPGRIDAISSATPLAAMRMFEYSSTTDATTQATVQATTQATSNLPSLFDMFIGNISGSLGETSALALLLGGIYLIWRGHIDWRIPVYYLGSVFIIMLAYGSFKGYGLWFPLFHLLGGGLLIGAFFMATDWVTSPLTAKGRIVFALGLGLLTCLLRLKSGYTEGVCYSILLMNMLTPLIDRYTKQRVFGRAK